MRLLFILHQFYPEFFGGTEKVALNLARCAQHAGHHVQVLACAMDPDAVSGQPSAEIPGAIEAIYHGVPVIFLRRSVLPANSDIDLVLDEDRADELTSWLAHQKFDVVHVLHAMRMASAIAAVQRCGLPYLVTLTDFFCSCFRVNLVDMNGDLCAGPERGRQCATGCLVPPWTRKTLADRYRNAEAMLSSAELRVCASQFVADRFRHAFPDLEFNVIPHGIDFSGFGSSALDTQTPDATDREIVLGFVGAVVPHKGLDTLLEALARIPTARLKLRVTGGTHGDLEYNRKLERLAASDSRVEFLGRVAPERVIEVFREIDVLCLPFRLPETFSLVLHEAAAAGVPALVSDIGAPGVLIGRDGGGRCLPVDDVEAWATAILDVVAHPELLGVWRSELSLPLRVEEEAFLYESLYRSILDGRPAWR